MGVNPPLSHNTRSFSFGLTEVGTPACSLCGGPGLLEQDHDHRSDLCRGLLCSSCNHLVARFDRPVADIHRFLAYLTYWEQQHAAHGGRTYTDYMREMFPEYGRGRRAPRPAKRLWPEHARQATPANQPSSPTPDAPDQSLNAR